MRAFTLAIVLLAHGVAAQELITNGGFESGTTGWDPSGNFYIGQLANPRSGSWYAYLSTSTGTAGNTLYGTLEQEFSIPSNIISASLRFYYSISSTDTASTADFLTVWFPGTGTQRTFSNLDTTVGYQSYTFDLTQYAGQTLTIQFLGTTNASNPTVFRIDDVSATYVSAPTPPSAPTNLQAVGNGSQILLGWTDNANNETNFEVERTPLGGTFGAWKTLNANITATEDAQTYGSTTCYRVRAKNAGGVSGYTNEACATSLESPTLLQPPDGSTTSNASVTMTWRSTLGATFYGLNVGTTCGGTQHLVLDTAETSHTLSVNPGTYVWQVRAANGTYPGLSQPSNCRTFTVTGNSPVASFNYTPASPTVNETVQFTDTSTGTPSSWSWNFGDGSFASVQHPNHAYSTSGTYTVQLTVTNSAGTDTTSRQATVSPTITAPVADFTYTPGSPVAGQQVSFTDTSANAPDTWSWDFGGTGTSTQQYPTHTFAAAGTYAVKLKVGNLVGSSEKTRNVTVQAPPPGVNADFTFSPSAPLVNQTVSFTDTSTGGPTSWEWDLDGNNTADSTLQNPSRTYTSTGSYSVTLTARNATSSSKKTRTVTVQSTVTKPVASFTYEPSNPGVAQAVTFRDTSQNSPTSWSWTFGDGSMSTAQHPSHTYSSPGSYTVQLTATNSAGNHTASRTVTVTSAPAKPVPSFTWTLTNPSAGQRVDFTDTSAGNPSSWFWDFADGSTSTAHHPSHAFVAAGSYNVRLTATNAAGSASTTRTITVTSAGVRPTARFTPNKTVALVNEPITFTDESTGNPTSWRWNFGDNRTSTTQHPTHAYGKAGSYVVSLVAKNAHGEDSISRTIAVTSAPVTIAGAVKTRYSSARIRGGTNHPRAVRLVDFAGNPTSYVTPLRPDGTYSMTVPPGTYSAVCSIEYDNDITAGGHPRRRSASARRDGCNGSTPCDIEFAPPIVFLHGLRKPFDDGELRWTLWRNSVPSEVITFAPHYDYTPSIEGPAAIAEDELAERFALFTETPRFNIIAHSKGGLVARVLRATSRYKDHIQTAVLLGTPNDGSNCFSFVLSMVVGLSWCDVYAFNNRYPRFEGDVFVVAGTAGTSIASCPGEAGPNDGIVPVDSVFKITHAAGVLTSDDQVLNGIVVPERHEELGTKEVWLLQEIILPYINRTAPPPACPTSYVTVTRGCGIGLFRPVSALCLAGRGVAQGRVCTIPGQTSGTLMAQLAWQPPTSAGGSPTGLQTTIAQFNPCAPNNGDAGGAAAGALLGYYVLRSRSPITFADPALRIGFTGPDERSFTDPDPLPGVNYYAVIATYETHESGVAVTAPLQFPIRRRAARH